MALGSEESPRLISSALLSIEMDLSRGKSIFLLLETYLISQQLHV